MRDTDQILQVLADSEDAREDKLQFSLDCILPMRLS